MVKLISPASASCISTVFMGLCNSAEPWFLDFLAVYRILYVVYIVDVTGRVELRHEKCVSIPELILHKWTVELFEAQGSKLILDPLEIVSIGIVTSRNKTGCGGIDSIGAEASVLPGT